MNIFTCEKYHLDMPAEKQSGFCAKRHRNAKPGDYCLDCDRGIQASKEEPMALYKKTCKCGEVYEGGPTASACPKCREADKASKKKGKGGARKASREPRRTAAKAPRKAKAVSSNGNHESVKVLETLVAIGAVTAAQVESTRKYVREMFE